VVVLLSSSLGWLAILTLAFTVGLIGEACVHTLSGWLIVWLDDLTINSTGREGLTLTDFLILMSLLKVTVG